MFLLFMAFDFILGGFYKWPLPDIEMIIEVSRRVSDRRVEFARAIPSEEEEGVAKLQVEEGA